ncbi:MAG: hypothetical protein ABH833_04200 [Parcubacteria group bacterium]
MAYVHHTTKRELSSLSAMVLMVHGNPIDDLAKAMDVLAKYDVDVDEFLKLVDNATKHIDKCLDSNGRGQLKGVNALGYGLSAMKLGVQKDPTYEFMRASALQEAVNYLLAHVVSREWVESRAAATAQ